MSDAPEDYIVKRLDDVVAFKLEVKTIIAKCKLSQNREIEDFITVKNNMKTEKIFYLKQSII